MTIATFKDAEAYLASLPQTPLFTGEKRLIYLRDILSRLGDPQDATPMIHIAGTSGKGSTAYYASSLLVERGYTVGLMVSPHVYCVAERAQLDGETVPEASYCQFFEEFIGCIDEIGARLTYLEFLTVFSYWLFAKNNVDYAVIEVGVGGRLDTTNVHNRKDKIAAITDIGFDHTELLGDTLGGIACEKAGIISDGGVVVMYRQNAEIMQAVADAVALRKARLSIVAESAGSLLPLPSYQVRNSTLAIEVVNQRLAMDGEPLLNQQDVAGALRCVIPGRFERREIEGVSVVLDAAHNPQKIHAFTEAYKDIHPRTMCVVVVAFGQNKSATSAESLQILHEISDNIVTTEFTADGMDRMAIDCLDLAAEAVAVGYHEVMHREDPEDALKIALDWARQNEAMVVVTGSFYLISALPYR